MSNIGTTQGSLQQGGAENRCRLCYPTRQRAPRIASTEVISFMGKIHGKISWARGYQFHGQGGYQFHGQDFGLGLQLWEETEAMDVQSKIRDAGHKYKI